MAADWGAPPWTIEREAPDVWVERWRYHRNAQDQARALAHGYARVKGGRFMRKISAAEAMNA